MNALPTSGTGRPPSEQPEPPSGEPVLPQRRHLPHEVPPWVGPGARHFVTINARDRGSAPFAAPSVAQALLDNLVIYQEQGRWYLWLAVIMPDHLHFIATFNMGYVMARSISAWKGFQTRKLKVAFQSGFFDHRLRDDDAFVEKMTYIRENPVRKELVAHADDWPYVYDAAKPVG